MTGYGAAERVTDKVRIAVEIRTVNNRFYKSNQRLPAGLGAVEMGIDALLRDTISRGTINLTLTVTPKGSGARAPINADLLTAYWRDLCAIGAGLTGDFQARDVRLETLLELPGVVGGEEVLLTGIENLPAEIEGTVKEAIARLNQMRDVEGLATLKDMTLALDDIAQRITVIQTRAPALVEEYRTRLRQRVTDLIQGAEIPLDDQTLVREVAFFAERSDINEELARLSSHVAQYRELLKASGPGGRKLEFLTQEMGREVNTIGSKSSDSEVARQVVEIKVDVDRLREQSQNVE